MKLCGTVQRNKTVITAMIRICMCVMVVASVIHVVERTLSAPALMCFNVYAQETSKEGVRSKLSRLQSQEGLTLASFHRGIEFVTFDNRSQTQTTESFVNGNGVEGQGSISRDGTEIAFGLYRNGDGIFLAIARSDGSNIREFPKLLAPSEMCWSYDKSNLAVDVQIPATQHTPFHSSLITLNVESKEAREIGANAFVTSQCWSPNGKQIAYEASDNVILYDVDRKQSRVLAKGKFPTWSSDGEWLAFLDDKTYYAINPSGTGRKILFRQKGALSGLWWSPDSRIVAYLSRNGAFEGPLRLDVGLVRLRVRRMNDGSVDWVAQLSDAYLPSFQWVENKDLLVRSGSVRPLK